MGLIEFLIVSAFLAIGVVFAALERYALTVAYVIAVLVGGWFFFDPVQVFLLDNWREILFHQVPLYLGVGVAVSVVKWFWFVLKRASKIRDAKETFKPDSMHFDKDDGHTESLEGLRRAKFIKHWNNSIGYDHKVNMRGLHWREWDKPEIITDLLTPKAKQHVDDISYWIFFWPFVIVSTLFKDLIVKLAKHVARIFDIVFSRASRLLISNAAKDI